MLLQRRGGRHDVDVVEAVEGRSELREELERDVHLCGGSFTRHRPSKPWPAEGRRTENVEPIPAEGMPVADRRSQVLDHRLAQHLAVGLVEAEGQRIVALGSLEPDAFDALEVLSHCWPPQTAIADPGTTHRGACVCSIA